MNMHIRQAGEHVPALAVDPFRLRRKREALIWADRDESSSVYNDADIRLDLRGLHTEHLTVLEHKRG